MKGTKGYEYSTYGKETRELCTLLGLVGREPNFGQWGSLLFVSPATDTIILLFLLYTRKKRAVFRYTLYELLLL